RVACRLPAFVILLVIAAPARADFGERYELSVGGAVTQFDTKIRINSRDNAIDSEIDFEDGLGFNNEVRLSWLNGKWRMAERHRLSVYYVPIRRTSEYNTTNDLNIDGTVIKNGAYVGASVKTHVFDIEYIYSFFKRPDLDIGFSAGIYWMNSLVELAAAGEIIVEGSDQAEFRADYRANQRLIAPLPLIGFTAAYAINPQWRVHGTARYLDVTINDIEGRILNLNLSTEYYFTNHVGAGLSLTNFDVSVRQTGVVLLNTLTYEYSGLLAYVTLKY
ncbi:MAG: hypothetical protein WBN36_06540, partial [Gammaproteobacteria bacterium]